MTKLEELKQRHTDLKKQIQDESKAFFQSESAALFDSLPNLKSFSWNQYTPYFNDGDECVFSVNKDYISVNGDDDAESKVETNKSYGDKGPNENYCKDMAEIYPRVKALLEPIDDDTFKEMFGDHVTITVTRDGVNVEAYSHD